MPSSGLLSIDPETRDVMQTLISGAQEKSVVPSALSSSTGSRTSKTVQSCGEAAARLLLLPTLILSTLAAFDRTLSANSYSPTATRQRAFGVREVYTFMQSKTRQGLTPDPEFSALTFPYLPLDRSPMERVFQNLIGNAIEAMPEGGTVSVRAQTTDESVTVFVQVQGPGIPAAIAADLFQPFVTAGKKNGVGLGLALSRKTVQLHGGDLSAEPVAAGACFRLRLPA